jgi:choline dehydrogenase
MNDAATASGYDVVIVGGGVAGCVLAARLSEDPSRSVLLIEAGPDYGTDRTAWPPTVLDARVLPRDDVWERDCPPYRLRAKVLGGSSCINGCWHTWGSTADYAEWAARGGSSWSAEGLEPYRRTAVDTMRLRPIPRTELSAWSSGALAAAHELGYPEIPDLAAPGAGPGYGCPPVNAIGELRWNSAFAYLDPVRDRPNLTILAGATVERLAVRDGRVRQAEVVVDGRPRRVTGERYILAAGAFGSPVLLLRSGVGPAGELEPLGIPVAVDLPGVGRNLSDHPSLVLPLAPTDELNRALAAKEAEGELYASQVAIRAASGYCPRGAWDLHALPTAGAPLFGELPPGQYEVGIAAFIMKPRSRGSVRLAGADPATPALIDTGALTDPEGRDLAVGRIGLELAAELAGSAALKSLATLADPRAPQDIPDVELRDRAGSYWHPVGTCAMGPDTAADAVVDADGRVRGVANLRVVDASILPTVPAANTQLSVIAVAEMLARVPA